MKILSTHSIHRYTIFRHVNLSFKHKYTGRPLLFSFNAQNFHVRDIINLPPIDRRYANIQMNDI